MGRRLRREEVMTIEVRHERGMSNRAIARQLGVHEYAVRYRLARPRAGVRDGRTDKPFAAAPWAEARSRAGCSRGRRWDERPRALRVVGRRARVRGELQSGAARRAGASRPALGAGAAAGGDAAGRASPGCGYDDGTPVADVYESPFAFTGTIHEAVIDVSARR